MLGCGADSRYEMITAGLDVKLTPEDQIAVIEVNGDFSGYEGIRIAGGIAECYRATALQQFDKYLADGGDLHEFDFLPARKLTDNLRECVEIPIDYIFSEANSYNEDLKKRVDMVFEEWKAVLAAKGEDVSKLCDVGMGAGVWGVGYSTVIGPVFNVGIYPAAKDFLRYYWERFPEIPDAYSQLGAMGLKVKFCLDNQSRILQTGEFSINALEVHPSIKTVYARDFEFQRHGLRGMKGSHNFQYLSKDKNAQKVIIPEQYRVPHMLWAGDMKEFLNFVFSLQAEGVEVKSFVNTKTHPYIVVKRLKGAHGHGVRVFPLLPDGFPSPEAIRYLSQCEPGEVLIEGFVPSVLFQYENYKGEKFNYDACGRVLVDVVTDLVTGFKRTIFKEGYWRISPEPIDNNGFNQDSFKANLTGDKVAKIECMADEIVDRVHEIGLQVIDELHALES